MNFGDIVKINTESSDNEISLIKMFPKDTEFLICSLVDDSLGSVPIIARRNGLETGKVFWIKKDYIILT